ncbi:MAG TPA: YchF/TatD family DNA exonuclease [Nitrospinota bacterium]|nr:YchF/TatD family DNA exonuclease [Nitrospinota bacterium]
MLIDSHVHLEMPQFDEDRKEVINRFLVNGVGLIINIGSSLENSKKAVELARKHKFIYATVGIHPHDIKNANAQTYAEIETLLKNEKVVAVGETGLDYYKNYSPHNVQVEGFKRHIQIAKKHNKPIIVHCREAEDEVLSILKNESAKEIGGIIHCFSGSMQFADECLNLGFYISFSGNITYPKAKNLREVVKIVPSDRLLIETDAPFLSPQSKRGKRNEPAFVQYVAEKVAELKILSREDVERNISRNIHRLFGIGDYQDKPKTAYKIRNSLYLNITNRCTNHCVFCERETDPFVQGHNLRLAKEPEIEELWEEIGNPTEYDEIVFCGYGEPTLRLSLILDLAKKIKAHDGKVRLNTNGHGNLIHKRDILPDFEGLIDTISISLNAETEMKYNEICHPGFESNTFEEVKRFIRKSKKYVPNVVATVVDIPNKLDTRECERIAKELGVEFRVRSYNVVG